MIARIWTGAVRKKDGDAYARYMKKTGVTGYVETPGNRGVWMLRRDLPAGSAQAGEEEQTEFMMFTLWNSLDAIKSFAGDNVETAVFYPEDNHFLVRRDLHTTHYEVDTHQKSYVDLRMVPCDGFY